LKGGYQPTSRLATLLDEIRMEAAVARASHRRTHRDRALEEIQQLAKQCATLVNDSLTSQPKLSHHVAADS
jgi:ribosomal protein L32